MTRPPRIYLDHAATTPVLPEARAAMTAALDTWANPSSPHAEGRAARSALEGARERIKAALGWNGDLIFTSTVSEAAALAFARCWEVGPKPAVSAVEHDAIRSQVPVGEGLVLTVGADGLLDPEVLGQWLRLAPGGLVAVQDVNSETGVIQPIPGIGEAIDAAGSFLLVDCAQSAGKLPLPPADMLLVSSSKVGGPPGAAALLVRDLKLLVPTGGQEKGYRRGTENLPAILGWAAALEARPVDLESERSARQRANRFLLEEAIMTHGGATIAETSFRSPFIGAYAMPAMSTAAQLVSFDALGFAVSAGSACATKSLKPSPVLAAMGVSSDMAGRTIRVSFSLDTTEAEVRAFADAWIALAAKTGTHVA